MDPKRFDVLVRSLVRSGSRRRLLGGLAAGSLTPLRVVAKAKHDGPEPAKCLAVGKRCSQPASAVAGHGKGKRKGKHHTPACGKCCSRFGAAGSNGKTRCACKGEGTACDNPSQCCSRQCRNGACTACPPNTVFCGDGCANLQTDKQHCDSCDKACDAGQRCEDGACVCDGPCGCTPVTCGSAGRQCGTMPDGCGSTINCGKCSQGRTCIGGDCTDAADTCEIGQSTCTTGRRIPCNNGTCDCDTAADGGTVCRTVGVCRDCASNADCDPGFVCVVCPSECDNPAGTACYLLC